jgi:signal transduction histidine kinase
MTENPTRFPASRAAAEDSADTGTPALHLLLDLMRRLRARERGYLADLLHDGPIQELAVVTLQLSELRRDRGTGQ